MYYDLSVPVPSLPQSATLNISKKGKGKQQTPGSAPAFNATQISAVEARIDLLVRCKSLVPWIEFLSVAFEVGYTVFAFNQFVTKRVDQKSHVNTAEALVDQLRKRPGLVYLRRLSIILDGDSEKGFGLTNANSSLFASYDLIGLVPLTQATFSLACLTHSMPSPLTAHIISLPLTLPRLSYHLKHTLIRTAIKNGAVFEISYVGALGGEHDPILVDADGAENGPGAKKNWWAAAKEVVRVTKGKNLLISGGVMSDADLRAPKDVGNLITILGLAQDVSHSSLTKVPKSLVLRAQTRFTYRAVFSEPKVVISQGADSPVGADPSVTTETNPVSTGSESQTIIHAKPTPSVSQASTPQPPPKKRPREGLPDADTTVSVDRSGDTQKKRRKKNKGQA